MAPLMIAALTLLGMATLATILVLVVSHVVGRELDRDGY